MNINEKINSNPEVRDFFAKFDGFRFDFLEHSVKITKDKIWSNRFLLAENKKTNSKQTINQILSKLTNNQHLIKESLNQLILSDRYLFAIEVNDSVSYRIYFETDMTKYREKVVSEDGRDRTTTIVGYRWFKDDDKNVVVTNYEQLIDVSTDKVKLELQRLNIQYVPEYFDAHKILRFYSISENVTKRNSTSFQLKNFNISNIEKFLVKLNPDSKQIIDNYSKEYCGNIAYGFDKNQKLFHTFYFTLYNNVYTQKRSAR